jgi:2-dehydropantoate 2-reductase
MRTLIVGDTAIDGYFGGRLLEASRDVTFLVRPRRAAELARTVLSIRSRASDADQPGVQQRKLRFNATVPEASLPDRPGATAEPAGWRR